MHWISKSLNDILSQELKDKHFSSFHNSNKCKRNNQLPISIKYVGILLFHEDYSPCNNYFRNYSYECDN
jgi:hypothetical protein